MSSTWDLNKLEGCPTFPSCRTEVALYEGSERHRIIVYLEDQEVWRRKSNPLVLICFGGQRNVLIST